MSSRFELSDQYGPEPASHKWGRFLYKLYRVLTFRWELSIDPYDYGWDCYLNTAIDLGLVSLFAGSDGMTSNYIAKAGPYFVWIANYPYGYGSYEGKIDASGAIVSASTGYPVGPRPPGPSMKTKLRLRRLEIELRYAHSKRTP